MKNIDFDRAFAKTPEEIHESILTAFEKGEKHMKFRYKLISAVSAAAVLLVAFAVIALAGREMSAPKPDTLAAPVLMNTQNSPTAAPLMEEAINEVPECTTAPPAALPTEEPVYDAEEWNTTPEPTYTPVPMAAAYDSKAVEIYGVYCTEGGQFYHKEQFCSGMMNAGFCSLEAAANFGKMPCPVCCDFEIYVFCTEKGRYYHAYKYCSGMMNAEPHKISDGVMMQKEACPMCMPETVYANLFGENYHTDEHCSGMMNARETTGCIAVQAGKAPCNVCFGPAIMP